MQRSRMSWTTTSARKRPNTKGIISVGAAIGGKDTKQQKRQVTINHLPREIERSKMKLAVAAIAVLISSAVLPQASATSTPPGCENGRSTALTCTATFFVPTSV